MRSDGGDAAGTMSKGAGDKVQKHLPLSLALVEEDWPLSNGAAHAAVASIAGGTGIDRYRHRLELGSDEEGEQIHRRVTVRGDS